MRVNIPEKGKAKIVIERHDTWSLDWNLAKIIHPALVQLKATKHGAPNVDDADVPEELWATPKENDWDVDDNWFKRWDWVLDEMIWAFAQMIDDDSESKFHSGEIDVEFVPCDDNPNLTKLVDGPNHTYKLDLEGLNAHNERVQRGTTLFGKYYRGLWD